MAYDMGTRVHFIVDNNKQQMQLCIAATSYYSGGAGMGGPRGPSPILGSITKCVFLGNKHTIKFCVSCS